MTEKYPKWVGENYQGCEKEFTDWMRQVARETIFKELIHQTKSDAGATSQTEAIIEHWIMGRTKELTQTTERAFVFQLYEADRKGWFRYLPGELDSIEELLATMVDELEEGTSKYYDFKFIIDTIMPILRKAGAKPEDVWGLSTSISKARAAVPVIRGLLKDIPEDGQPSKKTTDAILGIAQKISNPAITFRPFREEMGKMRGRTKSTLVPIQGEKFHMPNNEQWILIKAPSETYVRAIETGLKGVIPQFDVKDAFGLITQLTDLVKKPKRVVKEQSIDEMLDEDPVYETIGNEIPW